MSDFPDFRPWPVIRDERFDRVRAVILLFCMTLILAVAFGLGLVFAGDVIATAADAAIAHRTYGADAIPMFGVPQ